MSSLIQNPDLLILTLLFSLSGLVLAGLSIPLILKRIPPNGLYGFRVKKTMENPEIWYPVNVYAGMWLLAVGLATVIDAIGFAMIPGIGIDIYAYCVLGVWVVIFGLAIWAVVNYLRGIS